MDVSKPLLRIANREARSTDGFHPLRRMVRTYTVRTFETYGPGRRHVTNPKT